MRKLSFLILLLIPHVCEARNLHHTVLEIPALIEIESNGKYHHGTGVFFDTAKGVYLVSAKHVFFNMSTNNLIGKKATVVTYSGLSSDRKPSVQELNLELLNKNKAILTHSVHDVVAIKITKKDIEDGKAVTYLYNGIDNSNVSSVRTTFMEQARQFKDVYISDDIYVFGYPVSIGLLDMPQFEYNAPLLRKGIIAGKNIRNRTIIIDCPIYKGNSGGPVIEVDTTNGVINYLLIGIVTQYIPYKQNLEKNSDKPELELFSNSGYAVVEPIDFVLELIDKQ